MTVTYTHKVANARLGGFSSLLVRWKGSVYKLFYKEFLIYVTLYCVLSLVYRFALSEGQKQYFEKLCLQFQHYTDLVPISFVLGFYVTIVVGRWWSQLENLPFPDRMMMIIGANVHGTDDRGRLLRRTLLRYLNLAQVLTYRLVSTAVYKRFPTMEHVVKAGLMTDNEFQQYESVKSENLKYWVPLMWFSNLLTKTRQEGRIYDDMTFKLLIEELNTYRGFCGWLINYDWISVPLVYTQVVTVAVYMFFMSTLLSRQYLDVAKGYAGHEVDLFVPIFTIGQFFFYMGWLKVAEQLINPFGEDDDDFEVNWCIDRNHEVTMIVADQMYAKHPKLEKDKFWNAPNADIPYTAAAANHKVEPYMGSTFDMRVDKEDMQVVHSYSSNVRMAPLAELATDGNNRKAAFVNKANDEVGFVSSSGFLSTFRHNARKLDKIGLLSKDDDDGNSDDSNDETSHSPRQDSHDSNPPMNDDIMTSDVGADDIDDEGDAEESQAEMTQEKSLREAGKDEKFKTKLKKSMENILDERSAAQRMRKSPKKRSNDALPALVINRPTDEDYALSLGITPQIDSDDEERRNAEERVYLSTRKRRSRGALPPRKRRPYKSGTNPLVLRHQKRLRRSSSALPSPDTGSVFSETDVGSGNNNSPFGSILSFGTSIPSPKQLRWAFRPNARHLYGDNTSMTSSMPSPSGNEGDGTDNPVTPLSPLNLDQPTRSGVWGPGASPHDVTMPFTENLRRRLQVVPSSSPSAQSRVVAEEEPLADSTSSTPGGHGDNLLMIAGDAHGKSLVVQKGNHLSVQTKGEKKAAPPSSTFQGFPSLGRRKKSEAKTNFASRDRNNNEQVSFVTMETGKRTAGSGTGLWNALKVWNAKRKQRKNPNASFRTVSSESDVLRFYDDTMLGTALTSSDDVWGLELEVPDEEAEVREEEKSHGKIMRTVSRSEEGRSGVPDDGDSGMQGTGEITWENEVKRVLSEERTSSRIPVSGRPNTLELKNSLGRKEEEKEEERIDPVSAEIKEEIDEENSKDVEKLESGEIRLPSDEVVEEQDQKVPLLINISEECGDLEHDEDKAANAETQERSQVTGDDERGYKSSSDEGYESSNIASRRSTLVQQSPAIKRKRSAYGLDSIPEKVSDDESRDDVTIVAEGSVEGSESGSQDTLPLDTGEDAETPLASQESIET